MSAQVLVPCVNTLAHGEAKKFSFVRDGVSCGGFVICVEQEGIRNFFAFRNRCTHVGYDLDMGTGKFWSEKLQRVYCIAHGAAFRPVDGVCDRGPCMGTALESLPLVVQGDTALIHV